jgi:hypothetical protein
MLVVTLLLLALLLLLLLLVLLRLLLCQVLGEGVWSAAACLHRPHQHGPRGGLPHDKPGTGRGSFAGFAQHCSSVGSSQQSYISSACMHANMGSQHSQTAASPFRACTLLLVFVQARNCQRCHTSCWMSCKGIWCCCSHTPAQEQTCTQHIDDHAYV